MKSRFPYHPQLDTNDCAPACLRMLGGFHGHELEPDEARTLCGATASDGTPLDSLKAACAEIGLTPLLVKLPFETPKDKSTKSLLDAPLPCVAVWKQKHAVIVYEANKDFVRVADPSRGLLLHRRNDFEKNWLVEGEQAGLLLLLEKAEDFQVRKLPSLGLRAWAFAFTEIKAQKLRLALFFGLMVLTSTAQYFVPKLTQDIVDKAINQKSVNLLILLLGGQLALFVGRMLADTWANFLSFKTGHLLNSSLISRYQEKLLTLPVRFFEARKTSDLLQRIYDLPRVRQFLTTHLVTAIISTLNLVVFGVLLWGYSLPVFAVFVLFSGLHLGWLLWYLPRRRELDFLAFGRNTANYDFYSQFFKGIHDTKLYGLGEEQLNNWKRLRDDDYDSSRYQLIAETWQENGSSTIRELGNLSITFLTAYGVMQGQLTLGMMLAIQYVIGQMNGPLYRWLGFIRAWQNAQISLERLQEVMRQSPERNDTDTNTNDKSNPFEASEGFLKLQGISFRYLPKGRWILDNLNLSFEIGKISALTAPSGIGKSTLLKIMARLYEPDQGHITWNGQDIQTFDLELWRGGVAAVLPENQLWQQTIGYNISLSKHDTDQALLLKAALMANALEFIQQLPQGFNTLLQADGGNLSQGQRQRVLLARALYRQPKLLLLDEATNTLDHQNERIIMDNLRQANITVVLATHRQSTIELCDAVMGLEKPS